ncbi:hypothetical protein N7504_005533 [Penicillium tannophilum]|nr:hypothetical protein N7504_005533 [Penicillium tannophilum]
MDIPAQMIKIAGAIAIACITFAAVVAVIYLSGAHLGYPFGQLILQCLPQFVPDRHSRQMYAQTSSQSIPFDYRTWEDRNARILGAALGFFFCSAALIIESYLETMKDAAGETSGWDIWRASAVLIRACVEGLLVLVLLRGARYIGQRVLNSL